MKHLSIMVLCSLLLPACATSQWTRPGTSEQEVAQDKYECRMQTAFVPDMPIYPSPPPYPGNKVSAGVTGFADGFNLGRAMSRPSPEKLFSLCMRGRGYR